MAHWNFNNIPDQAGRSIVVTGANCGIGLATARMLVAKGARVVLACRNEAKGKAAVAQILEETPTGRVSLRLLDLADLESVGAFARSFAADHTKLDVLILNAGVMVPPASTTRQGFELQFGVNHLGHFALTSHLLPQLQQGTAPRVVVISSAAATAGRMNFDDLHFRRGYKRWRAYGQSKLANQLFARELQRRLSASGSPIRVTAAHPGWTQTDLQRNTRLVNALNPVFGMQPMQGALPTLRAVTEPACPPAAYFGPHGLLQLRGYPVPIKMLPAARKDHDARQLWRVSETLTGARYEGL